MSFSELVLGIDGGGTKTVAWLADRDASVEDEPLGRGQAGPSNRRIAGDEVARQNLDYAVDAAFADAGLTPTPVASTCVGVAGSDSIRDRHLLNLWADSRGLFGSVIIVHDGWIIPHAAFDDGCGIALISGTGSLGFGKSETGETVRCGGWGPVLGDEGSGYAIVIACLRAALRAADGRDTGTTLLERLRSELKFDEPRDLLRLVDRGQYVASVPAHVTTAVADFAWLIFEFSRDGDDVATAIIEQAAGDLADMAESVVTQLRLAPSSVPFAFAGGVFVNQPAFVDLVVGQLKSRNIIPQPVVTVPDPVLGAVRIARDAIDPGHPDDAGW